uniref:Uncharacterized protein n=1 Tax=Chromera velia CCMP2878 TaxID=1169474 RepID=A0A0G4FKZ3_9ALVE|eukprot:Cvel_17552.t1-p1 / transcript=Cvel_17552.t1 / gene=Cvel_17552 / organism=Chromera_velia_CCMP2878 / gene_product=hypothetical protein / transcript_product=hypothetical protein / location=Cvel_scaffold1409:17487-24305(-) / protein_length=1702 / sequence_SO=supercontig / SO=protein_coding / is_pseudo=false
MNGANEQRPVAHPPIVRPTRVQVAAAVTLQRWVRHRSDRLSLNDRLGRIRTLSETVDKIQRWWRTVHTTKARTRYHSARSRPDGPSGFPSGETAAHAAGLPTQGAREGGRSGPARPGGRRASGGGRGARPQGTLAQQRLARKQQKANLRAAAQTPPHPDVEVDWCAQKSPRSPRGPPSVIPPVQHSHCAYCGQSPYPPYLYTFPPMPPPPSYPHSMHLPNWLASSVPFSASAPVSPPDPQTRQLACTSPPPAHSSALSDWCSSYVQRTFAPPPRLPADSSQAPLPAGMPSAPSDALWTRHIQDYAHHPRNADRTHLDLPFPSSHSPRPPRRWDPLSSSVPGGTLPPPLPLSVSAEHRTRVQQDLERLSPRPAAAPVQHETTCPQHPRHQQGDPTSKPTSNLSPPQPAQPVQRHTSHPAPKRHGQGPPTSPTRGRKKKPGIFATSPELLAAFGHSVPEPEEEEAEPEEPLHDRETMETPKPFAALNGVVAENAPNSARQPPQRETALGDSAVTVDPTQPCTCAPGCQVLSARREREKGPEGDGGELNDRPPYPHPHQISQITPPAPSSPPPPPWPPHLPPHADRWMPGREEQHRPPVVVTETVGGPLSSRLPPDPVPSSLPPQDRRPHEEAPSQPALMPPSPRAPPQSLPPHDPPMMPSEAPPVSSLQKKKDTQEEPPSPSHSAKGGMPNDSPSAATVTAGGANGGGRDPAAPSGAPPAPPVPSLDDQIVPALARKLKLGIIPADDVPSSPSPPFSARSSPRGGGGGDARQTGRDSRGRGAQRRSTSGGSRSPLANGSPPQRGKGAGMSVEALPEETAGEAEGIMGISREEEDRDRRIGPEGEDDAGADTAGEGGGGGEGLQRRNPSPSPFLRRKTQRVQPAKSAPDYRTIRSRVDCWKQPDSVAVASHTSTTMANALMWTTAEERQAGSGDIHARIGGRQVRVSPGARGSAVPVGRSRTSVGAEDDAERGGGEGQRGRQAGRGGLKGGSRNRNGGRGTGGAMPCSPQLQGPGRGPSDRGGGGGVGTSNERIGPGSRPSSPHTSQVRPHGITTLRTRRQNMGAERERDQRGAEASAGRPKGAVGNGIAGTWKGDFSVCELIRRAEQMLRECEERGQSERKRIEDRLSPGRGRHVGAYVTSPMAAADTGGCADCIPSLGEREVPSRFVHPSGNPERLIVGGSRGLEGLSALRGDGGIPDTPAWGGVKVGLGLDEDLSSRGRGGLVSALPLRLHPGDPEERYAGTKGDRPSPSRLSPQSVSLTGPSGLARRVMEAERERDSRDRGGLHSDPAGPLSSFRGLAGLAGEMAGLGGAVSAPCSPVRARLQSQAAASLERARNCYTPPRDGVQLGPGGEFAVSRPGGLSGDGPPPPDSVSVSAHDLIQNFETRGGNAGQQRESGRESHRTSRPDHLSAWGSVDSPPPVFSGRTPLHEFTFRGDARGQPGKVATESPEKERLVTAGRSGAQSSRQVEGGGGDDGTVCASASCDVPLPSGGGRVDVTLRVGTAGVRGEHEREAGRSGSGSLRRTGEGDGQWRHGGVDERERDPLRSEEERVMERKWAGALASMKGDCVIPELQSVIDEIVQIAGVGLSGEHRGSGDVGEEGASASASASTAGQEGDLPRLVRTDPLAYIRLWNRQDEGGREKGLGIASMCPRLSPLSPFVDRVLSVMEGEGAGGASEDVQRMRAEQLKHFEVLRDGGGEHG